MSGRIFVEYDEIEKPISKSRLQNDERPNTKESYERSKIAEQLSSDKVWDFKRNK